MIGRSGGRFNLLFPDRHFMARASARAEVLDLLRKPFAQIVNYWEG